MSFINHLLRQENLPFLMWGLIRSAVFSLRLELYSDRKRSEIDTMRMDKLDRPDKIDCQKTGNLDRLGKLYFLASSDAEHSLLQC